MITINQLTIRRSGRVIIDHMSQQIPAGSITAIVGPNGSGKSTLLAAIAGDIYPDSGTITIDDISPHHTSAGQLAQLRAMAIQNQVFTLGFSVRQVIQWAGPPEDIMKVLDLEHLADREVTTLSGGEVQRVAIAQAMAQKTPVLLLDEPLSAQDITSRQRIIKELQRRTQSGTTVIVVVHSSESDLTWADMVIQQSL